MSEETVESVMKPLTFSLEKGDRYFEGVSR